jgi:hypothetical protein
VIVAASACAVIASGSGGSIAAVTTAKCVLPPAPHATTRSAPTAALLATLGVLRRPARPSDALPASVYRNYYQEVFVRYIRRARVVDGIAYYVWPSLFTRCGGARPYEGITFYYGGGADVGLSAADIEARGDLSAGGGNGQSTILGLVPDGVDSVTLSYPRGHGHSAFQRTAKVVANVVVIEHVPLGPQYALRAVTTWSGPDGQVVKTLPSI